MTLRNAFENLALESTLAHTKNKFEPGVRTTQAFSISTIGDNIIVTPALGNFIRLHWIGLSTSENNSAETITTVKFGAGGVARYIWNMGVPGAFMHWESIDGGVDESLIVNLSTAQTVKVNTTFEEI